MKRERGDKWKLREPVAGSRIEHEIACVEIARLGHPGPCTPAAPLDLAPAEDPEPAGIARTCGLHGKHVGRPDFGKGPDTQMREACDLPHHTIK